MNKQLMALIALGASFSFSLSNAEEQRSRPQQQLTRDAQQHILNGVLGIVSGGINIATHDYDPETQFNAGLGIVNSLGSLIFHLARSIDPEDLRSMSEAQITQELQNMDIELEVQKRMQGVRLARK